MAKALRCLHCQSTNLAVKRGRVAFCRTCSRTYQQGAEANRAEAAYIDVHQKAASGIAPELIKNVPKCECGSYKWKVNAELEPLFCVGCGKNYIGEPTKLPPTTRKTDAQRAKLRAERTEKNRIQAEEPPSDGEGDAGSESAYGDGSGDNGGGGDEDPDAGGDGGTEDEPASGTGEPYSEESVDRQDGGGLGDEATEGDGGEPGDGGDAGGSGSDDASDADGGAGEDGGSGSPDGLEEPTEDAGPSLTFNGKTEAEARAMITKEWPDGPGHQVVKKIAKMLGIKKNHVRWDKDAKKIQIAADQAKQAIHV